MKMKALVALGLCLALTVPLLAQEKETKELDSVYITPFTGCRVILVGKGMEKLLKENTLEVLKNKFIQDYQESAKDKDFPATAKNIIYLAGADGKRRLKAIPDEVEPVNIKEEIKSFNSSLPPFHYTIYDLMKDYQYHIYVTGPKELDSLAVVDCNNLISTALRSSSYHERKVRTILHIGKDVTDTSFFVKSSKNGNTAVLGITPFVGAALINSQFAPIIGGDFAFMDFNKYGKPNFQAGFSYHFYMLSDFANKSFSNFYPISSYSLFYLKHYGKTGIGLSVGKFSTGKIFGSARNGSLDKAWKFGVINQLGDFTFQYDFIFDKQKHTNAAFTVRYDF